MINSQEALMLRRAELDRNYIKNVLFDLRYEGVKNIIDIGCGPGSCWQMMIEYNKSGRIYAIDISPDQIKKSSMLALNHSVIVSRADYKEIPFDSDMFDCVFIRTLFDAMPFKTQLDMTDIVRVSKSKARIGIICNKSIMPQLTKKPRHYDLLIRAYKAMCANIGNTYLKVYCELSRCGIEDIAVKPIWKDTKNPGREALIEYYINAIDLSKDAFCRAGIVSEKELLEYITDLQSIISDPKEYAMFEQVILTGTICKEVTL